jgi:hypothetical protein
MAEQVHSPPSLGFLAFVPAFDANANYLMMTNQISMGAFVI